MQKCLFLGILAFCCLTSCKVVSPYAEQKYAEANKSWEAGDKEKAVNNLLEAVKDSPMYYDARVKLGNYYREMGQHEKALAQYESAISIDSDNPNSLILAGETCITIARSEDVEESLKTYLKGQHKFSQALALRLQGQEHNFRSKLGKGICLLKRTLKEDAKTLLEEALALRPDDPDAIFYNAVLREKERGANKESIDTYQSVLAKNPNHLEALKQMGDTFKDRDLTETAREYYEKYTKAGGSSRSIKKWMEDNPVKTGDPGTAKGSEKEVIMVCPECGRIGKKGQVTCDFDGAELVRKD